MTFTLLLPVGALADETAPDSAAITEPTTTSTPGDTTSTSGSTTTTTGDTTVTPGDTTSASGSTTTTTGSTTTTTGSTTTTTGDTTVTPGDTTTTSGSTMTTTGDTTTTTGDTTTTTGDSATTPGVTTTPGDVSVTEPAAPQEPAQPTIEKTGDPAKLTYQEGDVFDLTGFSAKVVATDGSETPVPADQISVDKTGALTTSDTTVTITVAPDGLTPATYNYAITVNASTPSTPGGLAALGAPAMLGEPSAQIEKTGDPAKLTYQAGDVFDLTGFSAEVVAIEGSATAVPADKISVDKTGPLATSDTEVTITVASDGLTPVTYPYTITVNATPAQPNPTYTFSSTSVQPGGTASVTVSLANNPKFLGACLKITYDHNNLILDNAQPGSMLNGISTVNGSGFSNPDDSVDVFSDDFLTPITGNGEFIILTFTAKAGAALGNYDIGVAQDDLGNPYFYDASFADMGITPVVNDGTILLSTAEENVYEATVDDGIAGGTLLLDSINKINDDSHVSTSAAVCVRTPATVKVTVQPDQGKRLVGGSLQYTADNCGTYMPIITQNGGAYSFEMPANNVTVTARFEDAAPTPAPAFTLGAGYGKPGDYVTIPVYLTGNPGIYGFCFGITYDSNNLTVDNVQPGSMLNGESSLYNGLGYYDDHQGQVNINVCPNIDFNTFLNVVDKITGNGEFVLITFHVKSGAASGDYDIKVTRYNLGNPYFQDENGNDLGYTLTVQNGTISVSSADGNTHSASVDSGITGGCLMLSTDGGATTASSVSAATPATVTVTVTPDAGNQLVSGSLTYTAGSRTYAPTKTNGVYSFPLTAQDVVVTAKFEAAPKIVVISDPAKLSYLAGEKFDLTGFSAAVQTADGTKTIVPAGQSTVDKTGILATSNTQVVVTVSPTGVTPETFTYNITVRAGTPADIVETSGLTHTTYFSGDSLTLGGSDFVVNYGGTVIIKNGYPMSSTTTITADPSLPYTFTDADVASGKDVQISVTYNGVTQVFTQHFTVFLKPQITLSAPTDAVKTGDTDNLPTVDITATLNGNGQDVYGFQMKTASYTGAALKSYTINNSTTSISPTTDNTVTVKGDGSAPVIPSTGSMVLHLKFSVPVDSNPGSASISISSTMLLDGSLLDTSAGDTLLISSANLTTAINGGKACTINSSASFTTTTTDAHPLVSYNNTDYYHLSTPADLMWFANKVNSGSTNIKAWLMNDIDMTSTSGFPGIGTADHPFIGELNVDQNSTPVTNKTITLNMTGGSNVGLFGVLGDGSTSFAGMVHYINVAGTIKATGDNVGGIAGKVNKGNVSYCNGSVAVASTGENVGGLIGSATNSSQFFMDENTGAVSGRNYVGGIVGSADMLVGDQNFCTNSGAVTASGDYAGGIAGSVKNAPAPNSSQGFSSEANSGSVSGQNYVGGIAGYFYNVGNNSTSSAGTNSGAVSGQNNIGGFAGGLESSTFYFNVSNSPVNSGVITVTPGVSGIVATGGVAGTAKNTKLVNASNTGTVSGCINALGGVAGYVTGDSGSITNSWNTGNLTTTASTGVAGGIIGKNDATALTLADNVSLGDITAPQGVTRGGVIADKGSADSSGFTNNLYATDIGATDDGGAIAAASRTDFIYIGSQDNVSINNYVVSALEFTGKGDGTHANPYQLSTANDLIWFASRVNQNGGGNNYNTWCAVLTQDIDMSGVSFTDFPGIGAYNNKLSDPALEEYSGTFDGAGHTVTLSMSDANAHGFFYYCNGATIKNLAIAGTITNTGNGGVGGIAGLLLDSTVENCHNTATITANGGVGGIAGSMSDSQIIGCTNSGTINGGENGGIGGIVGGAGGISLIQACINNGDVTGGRTIGGIAGSAGSINDPPLFKSTVKILNCINTGKIKSTAETSSGGGLNPIETNSAGGIVGAALDGPVIIDGAKNTGQVSGTANNLGGILGYAGAGVNPDVDAQITVTNSTNSGAVISTYNGTNTNTMGSIAVGGIAGDISGAKENISGNDNTGPVEVGLGKYVSGIAAKTGNPSQDNSNNYTNKLYGDDANTQGVNQGVRPVTPPVIPPTHSGGDSAPSGTNPVFTDIPTVTTPQVETPGDSTLGGEVPVVEVPAGSELDDTNFVLAPAPIDTTGAAAQSTENPLLAQNDSKNPQPTSTEPDKATESSSKQATIFEVAMDTARNNPAGTAALGGFIVLLAGLGGYWRFRKIRRAQ